MRRAIRRAKQEPNSELAQLKGHLENAGKNANNLVESVPTPVRLTALASTSVNLEIFCYVRTADIDRFYTIQGDLFLAVNRELLAADVERV